MPDTPNTTNAWRHYWKEGRCICCRLTPELAGERCWGVATWMPMHLPLVKEILS